MTHRHRATLYVEHSVLAFPGTASVEWRSEIASVLDRARVWFPLDVVLVGRIRLDATLHQALHDFPADRVIFGGARSLQTAYLSAVQLDRADHHADQLWLLSTSLHHGRTVYAQATLDTLALHAQVRVLGVRGDVVTPVAPDDLEEVFAAHARTLEER